MVPLKLLSNVPFKQHLSPQTGRGERPLLPKCVWQKMEVGDLLATEQKKKKKKRQITVEAWKSEKFLFPFPLGRRKLSRSRDCQMLFFISLLWGPRKPEKPWLQQFSNHPIPKLRSFQMLCAIQTSWDSPLCAVWILPPLRAGMKAFFFYFLYSIPSRSPFFTSHSFPRMIQSAYPVLLDSCVRTDSSYCFSVASYFQEFRTDQIE